MARVTVEDCITKIPNRFDLVIRASQRSRQLSAGAPLSIERGNDKNPVAALREIAEETISINGLKESLVNAYRQHPDAEPQEEEFADILAQESTSARHNTVIPDSGAPEVPLGANLKPKQRTFEDDAQAEDEKPPVEIKEAASPKKSASEKTPSDAPADEPEAKEEKTQSTSKDADSKKSAASKAEEKAPAIKKAAAKSDKKDTAEKKPAKKSDAKAADKTKAKAKAAK